jgi:hypothetical protein
VLQPAKAAITSTTGWARRNLIQPRLKGFTELEDQRFGGVLPLAGVPLSSTPREDWARARQDAAVVARC